MNKERILRLYKAAYPEDKRSDKEIIEMHKQIAKQKRQLDKKFKGLDF